jgi:uncharacterized protein
MRDGPLKNYMPDLSITIDGKRQNDLEDAVAEVSIEDSLDGLSMLRLTLFDRPEERTLKFKWLDSSQLDPAAGREISVSMDYVERSGKGGEPIFIGFITALSPNFPSTGIPSIAIEGYDHSYKLQKTCSQKSFANMDDYSKIVESIAMNAGIGAGKIDVTGVQPKASMTINSEQSDYLFIRNLAERFGYYFFVRNKKAYFLNPAQINKTPINLEWGKDITSFNPRMSTSQVVTSVTIFGPSQERSKEPIMGQAKITDAGYREIGKESGASRLGSGRLGPVEVRMHSYPVASDQEAKAIAKGMMIRANNSFIEGECQCMGNPSVRAGYDVKITGVSSRFDGIYRVKRARHSLGEGGYTTTLDLMRGGA